jgi:hypothetical protein
MSDRRTFAGRWPRAFRVVAWLYFLVFTIGAVGFIPSAIRDLATLATPGQVGTVVVTRCTSAYYPSCYGDFTSTNGGVTITDAKIAGGGYDNVGDRHVAYGDSATGSISIPRSGGDITMDIVLSLVLLLLWIPSFVYCVYLPIRRRRSRR